MSPSERVRAFLIDFERAYTRAAERFESKVDFEVWGAAVRELEQAHFVPGASSELAYGFARPPRHGVSVERIVGEHVRGDLAVVEAESGDRHVTYYEYLLREGDGDWRIERIDEFLHPVGEPFVAEGDRARYVEPAERPLREVEAGVEVNGDRLFEHGREVRYGTTVDWVRVRDVGTLRVTSGVLVVGDLGYDASLLVPRALRVPPGEYPVQVAVAYGRNAALRVVLSHAPVVAWHPADGVDGGHVVDVDAGNVAVLDASAVLGVDARQKERLYNRWARSIDHPVTRLLSLSNEHDGVIAASGWGDGAYPIYWGMDANGAPAVLLADFLVLAEWIETSVEVVPEQGRVSSPELVAAGVEVTLAGEADATVLTVSGEGKPNAVVLLDEAGAELADTVAPRSCRIACPPGRTVYRFDDTSLALRTRRVRVTLPAGRRN